MSWTGECYECHRERELETRLDHAAKALCDDCAAKPHHPPTAAFLPEPKSNGTDPSPPLNESAAAGTWVPVDLEPVLSGDALDNPPSLLTRADGVRLLYRGKVHSLSGEPEAGKGWLALHATAECLRAGERVLYVDLEDSAATIVSRLISLGVSGRQLLAGLSYMRPDEPLTSAAAAALVDSLPATALVVIDGVTEALALNGLDLADNSDVAKWLAMLPRRLAARGAAVLLIDHVVKDKEHRGRYAIGAQHKLAGVDVAYSIEVSQPFGRGKEGSSRLKVMKDRYGFVREHADDKLVAIVNYGSFDNGDVRVELEPPAQGAAVSFRPTRIMEAISKLIEDEPGIGTRAIRSAVGAKAETTGLALDLLVLEDYVTADAGGRGKSTPHWSKKPYREAEDNRVPVVPNRVPDTVAAPCPRVPPLKGDTDTATPTGSTNRVPLPEVAA